MAATLGVMLSAYKQLSIILSVLLLVLTLVIKGKKWAFFMMTVYFAFALGSGLVIKQRKSLINEIEQVPKIITGRVVKLYRNGFDIETERGKIRIYIARDQAFKYNLFRVLGSKESAANVTYLKSDVEALAAIDDLVIFENIQLMRVGNFKKAEKFWEVARGRIGSCTALVIGKEKQESLSGNFSEKDSLDKVNDKEVVYSDDRTSVEKMRLQAMIYRCLCEVRKAIVKLEKYYFDKLKRNLTSSSFNLAKAVITGNSSYLNRSEEEWFRRCGLMHVIAVSGTHITVIYGCIIILFRFLRVRKIVAILSGILFSLIIVLFSGVSPSALRAWVVFILVVVAYYSSRGSHVKDLTHFSYFFLILIDPLGIYDISLVLSFAAVFALCYIYPVLKEITFSSVNLTVAEESLLVLWSVQLAVNPVLAFAFKEVPLTSSLASLIVVPLMSLFLMLLVIVGFLPEGIFIKVCSLILNFVEPGVVSVSRWFSYLPASSVKVDGYVALIITLSLLALIIWIKSRSFKLKLRLIYHNLILLVILLSIFGSLNKLLPEKEKVIFFDVGEGNASLFVSRNISVLFDCGPPDSTLLEKLVRTHKEHINHVFLSHYHLDHTGGLSELLYDKNILIGAVFLPEEEGDAKKEVASAIKTVLKKRKIPVILMDKGVKEIIIKNAKIEVFSNNESITSSNVNENCLAFGLYSDKLSCLFLADMPADVQKMVIPEDKKFDIITVAHHGSEDGFSEDFFKKKKPELAVISCGENIYGHPSPYVIKGLEKLKIRYLITQYTGDIVISN